MAEKTLALPLAGNEIIEAVLDILRGRMQRDCFLNPNSAYDFFTAKVSVDLEMHDTGRVEKTHHEASMKMGDDPGEGEQVHVDVDIQADKPNKVRVETGQPVPVQTTDPTTGKVAVKHAKYSRKDAAKVAATTVALFFAFCLPMWGQIAVKPSPASSALMEAAKDLPVQQKMFDDRLNQARFTLDATQKSLRDQIASAQKALEDRLAGDKKYAADVAKIKTMVQQLTDSSKDAESKFQQSANTIQDKIKADRNMIAGLVPVVRAENNLPATAVFDEKTQTWSDKPEVKK
jgi:hypothetical protein